MTQKKRGARPKSKTRSLTKAKSNALSTDVFDDAQAQGFETVQARDLLVPRLVIAQKLSPQLDKKSPNFIEEASEGDLCETGAGVCFETVKFLPVAYRKSWIEWAPRKEKRGIVAVHENDKILSSCTMHNNRPFLGDNSVVETAQFFGFLINEEDKDLQRCFLALTSTQLRKARRWLHIASSVKVARSDGSRFRAPLWYHCYELGSTEESNNEGSWYGLTVKISDNVIQLAEQFDMSVSELADECKEMHRVIAQGEAKPNYQDEPASNHNRSNDQTVDDEVPF